MTPVLPERATVSVIIPTFNRAAKCLRAVNSVLAQTHSDVEVIVVDDGSTDDTRSRFGGTDARVKYLWQQNAGVSSARNRGLQEVTGEYVAFLDSDDSWMPRKLEAQLRLLNHFGDAVMTWSDMDAVDERGNLVRPSYLRAMYSAYADFDESPMWDETVDLATIWPTCPSEWRSGKVHCGNIYAAMFMGNLVHTSTVVLRASTREAVGEFDESLLKTGEDYDYHFRTCAEGRVVLLDLATILYEVEGPDQLTSPALSDWMARNNLRTIEKAWDRNGDRIDLPPEKIARRWAGAHRWVGQSLSDSDPAAGREHLLRSLRYRPTQLRVFAMIVMTVLPGPVKDLLRSIRRVLIHRLFGTEHS